MPESVKISELPVLSSVQPGDIVPVVDSGVTQTYRCTAAQIAAIGGGPPGTGLVTTTTIADRNVTYPKIQNVTADRLLGRTSSSAGVVEEIPCTSFMRGVLAAADSAAACTAMGTLNSTVDASFTGPAKFSDGTASAPAITNIGDTNTGILFPLANTIGFSTDGYERLRLGEDGSLYANYPGTSISTELRSAFLCRAWIRFDGTGSGSQTISNQHVLCQRYVGTWGSLLDDSSTRTRIATLESGFGNTISSYSNVGTEGRTNYTSPGDNTHFRWNGSAWVSVPATTGSWIGAITLTSSSPTTVLGSGNVSSVSRASTGSYTVNFSSPMPDANYSVVVSTTFGGSVLVARIQNLTTTGFAILTTTSANGVVDPTIVCAAVFR